MLPAQQRFGPYRETTDGVEFGLVIQPELLVFEGIAQVLQQLQLLARVSVHRHIEEAVAILAHALGVVHRGIGVHQQLLGVTAVAGVQGNADAGGDFQRMLGHLERAIDQRHLAFSQAEGIIRLRQLHQQHELIPADTRQGVLAAQVFTQALADLAQQLISQVVAEGIVDRFEAIQVDKHQGEATALLLNGLHRLLNTVCEQGAIGQAGEHVVQGQVGQFLVRQGQGVGEYGGAGFQARIKQRGQQCNGKHGQGRHQHQVIQALATQAGQGGAAETVIGKACRGHTGVMHANNGKPHYHRRPATYQAYVGSIAPKVKGDPKCRAGRHHRYQQRHAKQAGVVVDARRHAHRGHAGVMHAGDAHPHDQRAKHQLPGGQVLLAHQP